MCLGWKHKKATKWWAGARLFGYQFWESSLRVWQRFEPCPAEELSESFFTPVTFEMEPNAFGQWVSLQTYQSSGIHFVFWWIFGGRVSLGLWTTPCKLPKVSSSHMHRAFIILGGGFNCFCVFIPIWGNDPIWLIFFNWVETTNEIINTMIRLFFQMYKFEEISMFWKQAPQNDQNDDWFCGANPFVLPQGRMVQGTPVYDDTRHLVETSWSFMVPKWRVSKRKCLAHFRFPPGGHMYL